MYNTYNLIPENSQGIIIGIFITLEQLEEIDKNNAYVERVRKNVRTQNAKRKEQLQQLQQNPQQAPQSRHKPSNILQQQLVAQLRDIFQKEQHLQKSKELQEQQQYRQKQLQEHQKQLEEKRQYQQKQLEMVNEQINIMNEKVKLIEVSSSPQIIGDSLLQAVNIN